MDVKKVLVGTTLGGTALGVGIGGIKGLEKGLDAGIKIGLVVGVTIGVMASTAFGFGKKQIKKKHCLVEWKRSYNTKVSKR